MQPEPSDTLTLADLSRWTRRGPSLAVLGHPIKHSVSPAMHNAALQELSREQPELGAWRYFRFDVPPAELPEALARLREAGFVGLNLTVPHKVIAVQQVAAIDDHAAHAGAVNTLRLTPAGWHGYNTDGHGLAAGVEQTLGLRVENTHVVLLGAGGAARGAAVECLQRKCASLWVVNRTRENLQALFELLSPLARGIPFHGFTPGSPPAELPAGALVINATSAGLKESDPAPIDLAALPRPAAVYDMIYNPPETRLLRQAAFLGLPHANGLSMLVHQGAKALEIWTQAPSARTAPIMAAAAQAAMRSH